jgi:4-amino-4-deoxy-L-arabinose transferase-like glycosyltransferase
MKSGDFNPHFFDYGGLIFYFHLAVATLRFITGAMSGAGFGTLDQAWEGQFYLWARGATALLSASMVYVIYRTGLRWSAAVALTASGIAAIHPALVREAHFALTDTPLTFLVAWTLLLSIIAAETRGRSWLAAAGAVAGAAAAIKYNGLLAVVMPLTIACIAQAAGRRILAAGLVAAATVVAFLVTAPYSVLDLPHFLNAFAYLALSYNQSSDATQVAVTYLKYLRNAFGFGTAWSHGIGWAALLLGSVGVAALIRQLFTAPRRPHAAAVLAFLGLYFWVLSHQSLVYGRYVLPLLPMVCLAMAIGTVALHTLVTTWFGASRARATAMLLAILLLPPVWQSAKFDWDRRQIQTQEMLARWLEQHVSPEDPIVFETAGILLSPGFQTDYVPRLTQISPEEYTDRRVRYLVSSSERFDPSVPRAEDMAYRTLLSRLQVVHVVVRSPEHPGPSLTIYRIPR